MFGTGRMPEFSTRVNQGPGKVTRVSNTDTVCIKRIKNSMSFFYKTINGRSSRDFHTFSDFVCRTVLSTVCAGDVIPKSRVSIDVRATTPGINGWGFGFINIYVEVHYKHYKGKKTTTIKGMTMVSAAEFHDCSSFRNAWFNNGVCGC